MERNSTARIQRNDYQPNSFVNNNASMADTVSWSLQRNDGGPTALMFAADHGHEAVAELLLERGADVRLHSIDVC